MARAALCMSRTAWRTEGECSRERYYDVLADGQTWIGESTYSLQDIVRADAFAELPFDLYLFQRVPVLSTLRSECSAQNLAEGALRQHLPDAVEVSAREAVQVDLKRSESIAAEDAREDE